MGGAIIPQQLDSEGSLTPAICILVWNDTNHQFSDADFDLLTPLRAQGEAGALFTWSLSSLPGLLSVMRAAEVAGPPPSDLVVTHERIYSEMNVTYDKSFPPQSLPDEVNLMPVDSAMDIPDNPSSNTTPSYTVYTSPSTRVSDFSSHSSQDARSLRPGRGHTQLTTSKAPPTLNRAVFAQTAVEPRTVLRSYADPPRRQQAMAPPKLLTTAFPNIPTSVPVPVPTSESVIVRPPEQSLMEMISNLLLQSQATLSRQQQMFHFQSRESALLNTLFLLELDENTLFCQLELITDGAAAHLDVEQASLLRRRQRYEQQRYEYDKEYSTFSAPTLQDPDGVGARPSK